MTDKELRKLNRAELLELLIVQTRRMDEMETELASLREQVKSRDLDIAECGTLAEAALRLNDVFRDADKAAAQYAEAVRIRSDNMLRDAERDCASKRREADEAVEAARRDAEQILRNAEEQSRQRKKEIDEYAAAVYGKLKSLISGERNKAVLTDEKQGSDQHE